MTIAALQSDSIVAIITAISAATVAIITALATMNSNRKKQLNEIHVLVNSRLSEALDYIHSMEEKLDEHAIEYDKKEAP